MTLTRARTIQYIGILLSLGIIAVGYWYFSARAGVKTNTSALQSQGVGDLSAGLAAYFRFDETTGSAAADSSTNGSNGTLNNMENGDWVAGQIGNGLDFDGSNENVTATATSAVNIKGSISLMGWVRMDTLPVYGGTDRTIVFNHTPSGYYYNLLVTDIENNGTQRILFAAGGGRDGGGHSPPVTLSTGTWYHIASTYDATGDKIRYFLNGTFIGEVTETVSGGYASDSGTLYVGSTDAGSYMDGRLDEVRVYSRALSDDEIGQVHRLTTSTGVDTSLKGYWSFNAGALSSTTAYDWSGAGNNGTVTNSPAVTEGRVGQALNFWPGGSDTDARVNVGNVSSLDVSTGDFTLTLWTKSTGYVDQGSGINTFAGKQGISACEAGYHIDYASANLPRLYIADSGCAHDAVVIHNVNIADNQWHMITGTKSGTNINIAVDGVFTTAVSAPTVGSLTNTKPFVIGDDGFADGARNPKGLIDEVRFYNRALSAAEIKSLFDRGAPDRGNTSALQSGGNGRLESGLAGYWKLDETTGSSAADASTNGNTGTLTNMENGDWVTGQIGNGLDFDGTNEYVAASATPFTGHSSGTITAWIKSTNASAAQTIFGISTLASSNYAGYFHTNANGKLAIRIKGNGSDLVSCAVSDSGSSAQVAASGTWTFVAITNDATGKKFYKNAYQQNNDCGSDTTWFDDLSAQTPVDASMGAWLVAGSAQTLFQGSLDEVRVYDHALSQDEITNLYRVTAPTAVDTGLKGYWSFNGQDLSGTSAYDRSGAGNTGTLTNGPAISEGVVGQALTFDGSDDYVNITDTNFSGAFTFSTWFNSANNTPAGCIFGSADGGGSGGAKICIVTGSLFFRINNTPGDSDTTLAAPAINSWHHLAVVRDGSNKIDVYLDGTYAKRLFSDAAQTGTYIFDKIGVNGGDSSQPFIGKLDEVRAYNRALSVGEIQALYDVGASDKTNTSITQPQGTSRLDSGLSFYLKLDEGSGTTATDASPNASVLTLTNGPTWTTGRIGGAVNFDGTDDILFSSSFNSFVYAGSKITTSLWYNATVSNGSTAVLFQRAGGGCDQYQAVLLGGASTDTLALYYRDTSCLGVDNYQVSGISKTGWHHIVSTYDTATGVLVVYVDGAQRATTTTSIPTGTISDGVYMTIGCAQGGGSCVSGAIDEFRMYNRVLSADEVSQLYRLGTPTGTDTGLKGYWSFNGQDMNGTTVYDRSGAANNGTLTNGPTNTEGKLGQGLVFDGSNDSVLIADSASLSPTAALTVSLWVKVTGTVSGNLRGLAIKSASAQRSWGIFTTTTGGVRFYVASSNLDGGSNFGDSSGGSIAQNEWAHVAAVFDGSGSGNAERAKVYINGVQQSMSYTGTIAASLADTTAPIELGQVAYSHSSLPGLLDEVRIYNRALSASEIQTLYKLSK